MRRSTRGVAYRGVGVAIYSSAFTLSHGDSSLIKQLDYVEHRRRGSWAIGNQD
jgi:hypothetical protein